MESKIYCLCGCGKEVAQGNKFIHGHNGRCRNKEAQDRITTAVRNRWIDPIFKEKRKKSLDKVKDNISKTVKKLWENTTYRENMMFCRKKKKAYEKASKTYKQKWQDPIYRQEHIGIYASNWQGGLSREPYPFIFDEELKNIVKERDGFCCQHPYCFGKSERLVVHHINYNKQDCDPQNLILLCNSCNGKVNGNRKYWEKLFSTSIMYYYIFRNRRPKYERFYEKNKC